MILSAFLQVISNYSILPDASNATPCGWYNVADVAAPPSPPKAVPPVPAIVDMMPNLSTIRILLFSVSQINTLPLKINDVMVIISVRMKIERIEHNWFYYNLFLQNEEWKIALAEETWRCINCNTPWIIQFCRRRDSSIATVIATFRACYSFN